MQICISLVFLFMLVGCSNLLSSAMPNPLKEDKGINTDVQLAKTANMTKKKQLVEIAVDATDKSNTTNTAEKISVDNTNVPWWIALMVAFMRPMVIIKEVMDLFRGKKDEIRIRRRARSFIDKSDTK